MAPAVATSLTGPATDKVSGGSLVKDAAEDSTPQSKMGLNSTADDVTTSPNSDSGSGASPFTSPARDSPSKSGGRDKTKAHVQPAIAEEEPLPPGLVVAGAAPPTTFPSRGSDLHRQGECAPCVWFWKPQGCQRGGECGYCHLCPEGEIKNRKKAKLASIRGESESEDGTPQAKTSPPMTATISPGSSKHGSGECRPCMWFYKPQGCQNEAECLHCHLCPEGEIKSRKKCKSDGLKMKKSSSSMNELDSVTSSAASPSPHKVGLIMSSVRGPPGLENQYQSEDTQDAPTSPTTAGSPMAMAMVGTLSIGSASHGAGDCRPCAWFHKSQGCANGAECRHCHLCPEGEIKARRKAKAGSSPDGAADADCSPKTPLKLPFPSALQRRGDPLPSLGSEMHGTDLCRPCAWFHKPGGCENGLDCRHCHVCPEGEIQRRRKMKVAQLKKDSKGNDINMEQALWVVQKQQEALLAMSMHAQQVQAMWEAVVQAEVERSPLFDVTSPLGVNPLLAASLQSGGSPFGSLGLMSPVFAAAASSAAMAAMTTAMRQPSFITPMVEIPESPARKDRNNASSGVQSARSPKTIKLSKIV